MHKDINWNLNTKYKGRITNKNITNQTTVHLY